jgi:hypothetical protein
VLPSHPATAASPGTPVTPRQGYGRRWLADIQHCLAQDHPIQGSESLLPNLPALCLDGIHFGAVAEIERRVVEFRSPSPDHWTEFMKTYFGPAILAFGIVVQKRNALSPMRWRN